MNKRNFWVGLVFVLTLSTGKAQTANQLGIGVKAGYNFNQFNQPGTMSGGQAGAFVRYQAISFLAIQGEILYDLQGGGRQNYSREYLSELNLAGQGIDLPVSSLSYQNRSVWLSTVSVPLSLKLTPPNASAIKLSILAGGSFDYILSARETYDLTYHFENGNSLLVSDVRENVSGDLGTMQFSAHVGAAMDFILDDGKVISYEMKYRRSLTNLNESRTAQADLTEDLYSTTFSLSVYYTIF